MAYRNKGECLLEAQVTSSLLEQLKRGEELAPERAKTLLGSSLKSFSNPFQNPLKSFKAPFDPFEDFPGHLLEPERAVDLCPLAPELPPRKLEGAQPFVPTKKSASLRVSSLGRPGFKRPRLLQARSHRY